MKSFFPVSLRSGQTTSIDISQIARNGNLIGSGGNCGLSTSVSLRLTDFVFYNAHATDDLVRPILITRYDNDTEETVWPLRDTTDDNTDPTSAVEMADVFASIPQRITFTLDRVSASCTSTRPLIDLYSSNNSIRPGGDGIPIEIYKYPTVNATTQLSKTSDLHIMNDGIFYLTNKFLYSDKFLGKVGGAWVLRDENGKRFSGADNDFYVRDAATVDTSGDFGIIGNSNNLRKGLIARLSNGNSSSIFSGIPSNTPVKAFLCRSDDENHISFGGGDYFCGQFSLEIN